MALTSRSDWKKEWQRRREANVLLWDKGVVYVYRVQNHVHVCCPPSDAWVNRARELGGKWLSRSSRWTFPLYRKPAILTAACEVFGAAQVRDQLPPTTGVTLAGGGR